MPNRFSEGWLEATDRLSEFIGSFTGDRCGTISRSIQVLQDDINQFEGFKTGNGQLSGNVAEFWHADTHNINAVLKGSDFRAIVLESHDLASADLSSNWGEKFGLKYLKDAQSSSKAQAISYFQRFKEFQYASGQPDLTFQDYLSLKGIPEDTVMSDPIYSGQIRVIPADQYDEAVSYLKWQIAKESVTRPDQVSRYKDTLDNLQKVVKDPNGITSAELSKDDAIAYAQSGKDGEFEAYETEFVQEDLIKLNDIVGQSLKAGASAFIITFTMKMAPTIIGAIKDIVNSGDVDSKHLKKVGLSSLPASAESYLRGFVASSFTLAYESGKLGNILHGVNPEAVPGVIGALTVIAISTIKDSVSLVLGKMAQQEFIFNLNKNVFVTGCAVGFGIALQSLIPALPFAYFIGNAVGTLVGSFAFNGIDNLFISLCIRKGYTFWGIVKQDYSLPDEVITELGIDWTKVDELYSDEVSVDETAIEAVDLDETELDYIHMLRRGVYKVHCIGFSYI